MVGIAMTTAADLEKAREHELKCWPEFFEKLLSGEKTFEARWNDRHYRAGDVLFLREWFRAEDGERDTPISLPGKYTGRTLRRTVTYVMDNDAFGIAPGYAILALAPAASIREERDAEVEGLMLANHTYQGRIYRLETEVEGLKKALRAAKRWFEDEQSGPWQPVLASIDEALAPPASPAQEGGCSRCDGTGTIGTEETDSGITDCPACTPAVVDVDPSEWCPDGCLCPEHQPSTAPAPSQERDG